MEDLTDAQTAHRLEITNRSLRSRLAACSANYTRAVEVLALVLVAERGTNGKHVDRALAEGNRIITEAGTLGARALTKAEEEFSQ